MKKKLLFPQKFVFLTPSEYRSLSHEGRLRYIAAIARQLQQIRAAVDASSKKAKPPAGNARPAKNKRAHA